MRDPLRPFFARVFTGLAAVLSAASCLAGVTNQASVSFSDPSGAGASRQSNVVSTTAIPADTISYFTGPDYATRAMVTSSGSRLYVQATTAACNGDPSSAETITIKITSGSTGDTETYLARETSADSGVFRVIAEQNATVVSLSAGNRTGASGDGVVQAMQNDTLTASIEGCGGPAQATSILVDPDGVVFDSHSNVPLANATVTLIDITGMGNGGAPNAPARVFAADGVTIVPSTVVTGGDGAYHFPLVAPSLYRLQVSPPTSYLFPSKLGAADLPARRAVQLYGSYGASFSVSAASGPVTIDVPLDPVPGALYLEKSASRADAEVGDVVDYTIRVHNAGDQDLAGVVITDALPAGFAYQPGTLRLDGAAQADPAPSAALQIPVGNLSAESVRVLRYRVRIGAGALHGDGINRAHANSAAPLALASSVAAAKVKVTAGVFSEKGFIAGSVFADCDGDGLKSANEPGVPGVRIYLEDGSFAVTDADGRYSFTELRPRTHVAKVDAFSLPAGGVLAVTSNRNAGDAGSRFVDLKDGELGRADFAVAGAVAGCSADLRAAIAARASVLRNADAAARKAIPAAAAGPAATKAATDLATLDDTLGFVDLADGALLPRAQASVRVKGPAGSSFTLLANGTAVAESRIGQRNSVAARNLESWEFVGVALHPGRNTLEVQQRDQFGNVRGSRRIDVRAPGALARIRVELDKTSVPADGHALALLRVRLEDADGLPVVERTPVTLDSALGAWLQTDLDPRTPGLQAFVEGGEASFTLRAPATAGETRIRAASGAVAVETRLAFVPDLRPLVAAGVFDGAVSLNRTRGNVGNGADPARAVDGFEDQLRHVGETAQLGARAAMFVKGKVGDDTLLTAAYDSDKADQQKLFRDLDPNAYYPTYGDAAQRGFEAQSTGRLYLRADRDKSWIQYGDMTPPGVTRERNLGAYARNLTGLRGHVDTNGLVVDAFASRDSTRQMVEEIAANGTSGPYLTGTGIMVINSETIEIVVRDRNQSGVILSRKQQARWADYDIEPTTGRILFRAPVPSLDADLNPVSVRISYEVDQGAPQFWVAGGAAQYKIGEHVEVGGSVVDDRNPALPTRLASVNATVRAGEKTAVTVEVAQMDKAGTPGRAARIDAVHSDERLETHLYAGRADLGFDNPSSNLPRGRVDDGARVRWQLEEHVTVQGEVIHSADLTTGASRDGAQLAAGYAFGNGVKVEAGVRHARENAAAGTVVTQPDLTSVRAKVAAQIPGLPQAGVYAEAEEDVRDNGRRMAALGGDYRFANGARVYGRHELISSLGSNYALNEGQQRNATVFGVDADYMKDGRVFSEYRARPDGLAGARQAEAALGLRNLWTVADGVRASTSIERVKVLAGAGVDEATAVAGAVEYARDPRYKANARLELRHGSDSDSLLQTVGFSARLSETWAFLAKNTLSASRSRGGAGSASQRGVEWLQTGVAYRALSSLGINGLIKYEFKRELDNGPSNFDRMVNLIAANASWQPLRDTVVSARYAAKVAKDVSSGLASRTVSQLVGAHLTHRLSDRWDIGAVAQTLVADGRQFGAGIEAGYQLRRNTWVTAGYNLLGFKERDLAGQDATAKGIYLRLRAKFDERSLQGPLSTDTLDQ